MQAAHRPLRVSPRPSYTPEPDELPRKLSVIARVYAQFKHTLLLPVNHHPERSSKRRRVADSTDMPREGKPSPSRRPPSTPHLGPGSSTSSASAREKPPKRSSRDGPQDRPRTSTSSSVAVAPSSTALVPGGRSTPHHASPPPLAGAAISAVPLRRGRMQSPEAAAFIQARIYQRRVELINKLMAIITSCLDKTLSAMEAACDGEGPMPGHAGAARGAGSISRSGAAYRPMAGQKRGNHNHARDSDGEDEGGERGVSRTSKRTKTVTDSNHKFACPYYKRDPARFGHTRTCSGPGWDEVHRVKEHLYRRHELPKVKCNRCYEYFEEDKELEDHQRMDTSCVMRDRAAVDPVHGFDEQQRRELTSRRKTKMTEVDRWKEVYSILFRIPIDSPDMPSPFYDSSDAVHAETTATINSNEFKAYVSYCRREAPKVIRQALENDLDREFGVIEERMRPKIARLLENSLVHLFATYQSIKTPEEVSSIPDPNPTALARDPGRGHSPAPDVVLQDSMTAYLLDFIPEDIDLELPLDTTNLCPGMGMSFQGQYQVGLCDQSFGNDSAYYSYSNGSSDGDSSRFLAAPLVEARHIRPH